MKALFLIQAVLLIRFIITLAGFSWKGKGSQVDLSIIIPLKGWDETFPQLVAGLINQNYSNEIELIVVVDRGHPHLHEIPLSRQVQFLHPPPVPLGWRDKNWRLFQGTQRAHYPVILFLDSDVVVDRDYLNQRMVEHDGHLSYSIALYGHPRNCNERFLASFTSYHSFYLYKFAAALFQVGTAIGASILTTVGKKRLLEALEANGGEIADDHALGCWFRQQGFRVRCISEPVYVAKSNPTFASVWGQINRWLVLPRTICHLFTLKSCALLSLNGLLNFMPSLCFYAGLLMGSWILIASSFLYIFTECLLLQLLEWKAARRRSLRFPLHHFVSLPLVFILQPLMLMASFFSRCVHWRGGEIRIQNREER